MAILVAPRRSTIRREVEIAGEASLAFGGSGVPNTLFFGSSALAFTATGTLATDYRGSADMAFSAMGTAIGAAFAMTGAADMDLSASGFMFNASASGGDDYPDGYGAPRIWYLKEAENGVLAGGAEVERSSTWNEESFEARSKACVRFTGPGQSFMHQAIPVAFDYARIRFSIPDGAANQFVALYVDVGDGFVKRGDFTLSGARLRIPEGQVPPPSIECFWDEAEIDLSSATVPAGSSVRIQRDSTAAVVCKIDFVQFESKPAARSQPAGSVAVTAGTQTALLAAIATANANPSGPGKTVWLGAQIINVTDADTMAAEVPIGVNIEGAGWRYSLINYNNQTDGSSLFWCRGNNRLRHFKIQANLTARRNGHQAVRFRATAAGVHALNCVLEDVWVDGTGAMYSPLASSCTCRRVRHTFSYKDNIHFEGDSSNNLIEDCWSRTCGDDQFALIGYGGSPSNNIVRRCTGEMSYQGRGVSSYGGDGNSITDGLFVDCTFSGVSIGSETWSGKPPNTEVTNFEVRHNMSIGCGQNNSRYGGGMSIDGSINVPMSGELEDNTILRPNFHGLLISGNLADSAGILFARNNLIDKPVNAGFEHKHITITSGTITHTPNTHLVYGSAGLTIGTAGGGGGGGGGGVAIAHGTSSESHGGSTPSLNQASYSWSHVPAAVPRGVLVFTFQANATNEVSAVSYGGVALTAVTGGRATDTAGTAGEVKTWFRGSGIPGAAGVGQTVLVTRANNANPHYAVCMTVTADADTQVIGTPVLLQNDGTLAEQSVNSGGTFAQRYAAVYRSNSSTAPPGVNSTAVHHLNNGFREFGVVMETIPGSGSRPVGFIDAVSDDRAAVHIAIGEV